MFNSAQKVLSHYVTDITRYNVQSITMHRGENPDDIFYLCNIKDAWYIIYESDYIDTLLSITLEAAQKFKGVTPLRWLTKKGTALEFAEAETRQLREALILRPENTHLRYLVFEAQTDSALQGKHFNPLTYGNH